MKKKLVAFLMCASVFLVGCNISDLVGTLDKGDTTYHDMDLFSEVDTSNIPDTPPEVADISGIKELAGKADTTETVVNSGNIIDPDKQIATYAAAVEDWMFEEEEFDYSYPQYGIFDIDGDGIMELLTTQMAGTGMFSTNRIYTLSEDLSRVIELSFGGTEEGDSEPDFIGEDSLIFYENGDGYRFWAVEDYLRNGYAENYLIKSTMYYLEGYLTVVYDGSSATYVDYDGNATYEYYDYDGSNISEEKFNNLEDDQYSTYKKYVANLCLTDAEVIKDETSAKEWLGYMFNDYFEYEYIGFTADMAGTYELVSIESEGDVTYVDGSNNVSGNIHLYDKGDADYFYLQNGEIIESNIEYVQSIDGAMYRDAINPTWYKRFTIDDSYYNYTVLPDGRLEMRVLTYYVDYEYPFVSMLLFQKK